jgi:signal transduction histidine kinase
MENANFENVLIGGGPAQALEETPEERSRIAAQLSHQMINGLTGLSLCCANLQRDLRSACAAEQLKDLTTIERSVATIADLARGLARCAQPTDPSARAPALAGDSCSGFRPTGLLEAATGFPVGLHTKIAAPR